MWLTATLSHTTGLLWQHRPRSSHRLSVRFCTRSLLSAPAPALQSFLIVSTPALLHFRYPSSRASHPLTSRHASSNPQITRIEYIHSRDFVHRDIKPANFVVPKAADGSLSASADYVVNVIDFGLAKKFRDPRTGAHIPYHQDDHHGVGTCLFASLNTHVGIEASRRDDLESLAYMLIYFLRGTLPWRKLKGETVSETWDLIRDKKLETEPVLTVGLPAEFDVFYRYVRSLEFEDLPDYEGLRALFRTLAERQGIVYDGAFDWCVPRPGESRSSSEDASGAAAGRKRKRVCRSCSACAAAAERAAAVTATKKAAVVGRGRA